MDEKKRAKFQEAATQAGILEPGETVQAATSGSRRCRSGGC